MPRPHRLEHPSVCLTNVQATGVFLAYFPPYKLQNTRSAQKYVNSSGSTQGSEGRRSARVGIMTRFLDTPQADRVSEIVHF